jgi:hypothetical protein
MSVTDTIMAVTWFNRFSFKAGLHYAAAECAKKIARRPFFVTADSECHLSRPGFTLFF